MTYLKRKTKMNKRLILCLALPLILAACSPAPQKQPQTKRQTGKLSGPSQGARDLFSNRGDKNDLGQSWLEQQCDTPASAFTKRVIDQFQPRIACSARIRGIGINGAYGTVTLNFANAVMTIQKNKSGRIIQKVDINEQAGLASTWFRRNREDFVAPYGAFMDWTTDEDPTDLGETYLAPNGQNAEVRLTRRQDNTIAQIWFSNPN